MLKIARCGCGLLIGTVGVLALLPTRAQCQTKPAVEERSPLPSSADLHKAQEDVDSVFADQISRANSPQDKTSLAKWLIHEAGDTSGRSAGKYVLLEKARDLAVQAGDLATAAQAAANLGASYDVDPLKLEAQSAEAVVKLLRSPPARTAFVEQGATIIRAMIAADRYDLARRLSERITAQASMADGAAPRTTAAVVANDVKWHEAIFLEAKTAFTTLASHPDDPTANLKAGRYRCFARDDWKQGLPLLAKSNDGTLQPLARRELAGASDPDDQLALAEGWWDVAEKENPAAQEVIRHHAGLWYREAAPRLSGLPKALAEKRSAIVAFGPTGLKTGTANSVTYDWSDPAQLKDWEMTWGNMLITPQGLQDTVRGARMHLRKPIDAKMLTVDFESLGGIAFLIDWAHNHFRVRIDAKFIEITGPGQTHGPILKFKFAKNQPYEMKIFADAQGMAAVSIGDATLSGTTPFKSGDFSITMDLPNLAIQKVQFDK